MEMWKDKNMIWKLKEKQFVHGQPGFSYEGEGKVREERKAIAQWQNLKYKYGHKFGQCREYTHLFVNEGLVTETSKAWSDASP